jgi:hypothetical protein
MHSRALLVALALGPLGLVAAGCGGSSTPPSVAHIGPTTTPAVAPASGSGPGPGAKAGSQADFVAFVDCMQKHGIQAQLGQGGRGVSITGQVDPNSAQFKKAQQTCQKLLPGGGPQPLSPAQQAQEVKELITLAACMRTHGYPTFPDPTSQGTFDFSSASGVNPNSTQFQTAMNTCRPRGGKVPLRIGFRVGG